MNPTPIPTAGASLDVAALEAVYDHLATAIDAVGADRSELFLVKLALLAANRLGSEPLFAELVQAARRDLDGDPPSGADAHQDLYPAGLSGQK